MSDPSEVFVVQDEAGLPIYCASYAQACHEHINDAINEHCIEEAKAWKVLRYSNYVLVPCHKCNSTKIATAVPHDEQQAEREEAECVHVVCKWSGDTCEFVECELDDGHSVSIEWHKRPDGYDELRLFRMVSVQQVTP